MTTNVEYTAWYSIIAKDRVYVWNDIVLKNLRNSGDTFLCIDSIEICWILTSFLRRKQEEGEINIIYDGPLAINRRYLGDPRNKVILFEFK